MLQSVEINPKLPAKASVIWLHGLGADGHDFASIVPELALPENLPIRFIFPHAPLRPITFAQGMPLRAWFDIKALNPEGINHDAAGIYASQKQITELIEKEIAAGIASERIVLAGFSQGGAMALQCGLHHPQTLAGILVLSGFLPLADQLTSAQQITNQNTPILMLHGTLDDMVPLELAKLSYAKLQSLGLPVKWQTYPMPHSVCSEEIAFISAWLQKIFGST